MFLCLTLVILTNHATLVIHMKLKIQRTLNKPISLCETHVFYETHYIKPIVFYEKIKLINTKILFGGLKTLSAGTDS